VLRITGRRDDLACRVDGDDDAVMRLSVIPPRVVSATSAGILL